MFYLRLYIRNDIVVICFNKGFYKSQNVINLTLNVCNCSGNMAFISNM